MKRTFQILLTVLLVTSCAGVYKEKPYEGRLFALKVSLSYDAESTPSSPVPFTLTVENNGTGALYTMPYKTGMELSLPIGIYRLSVLGKDGADIYNGVVDNVRHLGSDTSVDINILKSEKGVFVLKEIYCGGCKKTDADHPEGYADYQSDTYIIIHNNSPAVQYLDSLCIGTLDPYRSHSENVWSGYDFAAIIQAVLQIPGDGTTFPLAPGEDAVVCLRGAIDHAALFPKSVNLNKEDYFVLYEPAFFPNELYHPTPGDKISADRYLNVVIKTGQANAYTMAIQSPAVLLFKAKGTTIQQHVMAEGTVIQKPGSNADKIVAIPWNWVVDAVEVFENSTSNKKRIKPNCDAGYVKLTQIFAGHTLLRKVDKAATAESGYEVLEDTNNSTYDFVESPIQTLHADYGK